VNSAKNLFSEHENKLLQGWLGFRHSVRLTRIQAGILIRQSCNPFRHKVMKTKIALIIVTLACVLNARATLIDLTPGGFSSLDQPRVFFRFMEDWGRRQFLFFDEARVIPANLPGGTVDFDGWVSMFGILDGGTNFHTNLFDIDPTQVAQVSWDFTDLPGYSMSRILVFGLDANGNPWEHLYAVPNRLFGVSDIAQVTLREGVDIGSIAFFGRTPFLPVPDTGSTLLLFALWAALAPASSILLGHWAARKGRQ
jgi:hypothetical protein